MPDKSIWDDEESGAAGDTLPPLVPANEAPLPQVGVPAPVQDSSSPGETRTRSIPDTSGEGEVVVKTVEDAERAFAHVLERSAATLEKVAAKDRRKRGRTQKAPTGDGRCRAYAPYGTKCKLCGKMHPA